MSGKKQHASIQNFKARSPEVGLRIKMARQSRGMTQGELAELLETSSKTVSAMEVARVETSTSQLRAIAAALDYPIGYFVDEKPSVVVAKLNLVSDQVAQIQELLQQIFSEEDSQK